MFLAEIPDDCIQHKNRTGRTISPVDTDDIADGPAFPGDSKASLLAGARHRASKAKKSCAFCKKTVRSPAVQHSSQPYAQAPATTASNANAASFKKTKPGRTRRRSLRHRRPRPPPNLRRRRGTSFTGPASNRAIHINFDSIGNKESYYASRANACL